MYRHIERVRKLVEERGIKFTVLRAKHDFDYYLLEHIPNRKKEHLQGNKGYSWAGALSRWCTSKLKVEVMERYLRELRKEHKIVQCIGIAADEQRRLEKQYAKKDGYRFPLVEKDMTEEDALAFCYARGFDWEGLYRIFKRVSCWCCPLQSLDECRKLRKHFPELWQELREMDGKTWRKFKPNYSVEDLEAIFAAEDRQERMDI